MKAGERYESKIWRQCSGDPLIVKITKVTKSAIYYRPDYGLHDDGTEWLGSPAWIQNDNLLISKYLKSLNPHYAIHANSDMTKENQPERGIWFPAERASQ
jgi:hypothetical protein